MINEERYEALEELFELGHKYGMYPPDECEGCARVQRGEPHETSSEERA